MQDEAKPDTEEPAVDQPPPTEAAPANAEPAAEANEKPTEQQLLEQLQAAEARAAENWDKFLRAGAEQENIRKRAEKDVDQARRFALERFATDLLGVIDSLELGLKSAREAGAEQDFLDGMELTLKLLAESCQKHGVVAISPQGEAFDPNQHEAVTTVPSESQAPGIVVDVLQKGYLLNERLLRAAMVTVTRAP